MILKYGNVIVKEEGIEISGFKYEGCDGSPGGILYVSLEKEAIKWAIEKLRDSEKEIQLKEEERDKAKSTSLNCSSYQPYILNEIDNIIKNFHCKFPRYTHAEEFQENLNNKLLYIIRDLLIRIERLEKRRC